MNKELAVAVVLGLSMPSLLRLPGIAHQVIIKFTRQILGIIIKYWYSYIIELNKYLFYQFYNININWILIYTELFKYMQLRYI